VARLTPPFELAPQDHASTEAGVSMRRQQRAKGIHVCTEDEEQIECLRVAGRLSEAASRAIEAYGHEIFGYLVSIQRSDSEAQDAFSRACEALWLGMARFEGRASMRTWFYMLARHAALRSSQAARRAARGCIPAAHAEHLTAALRSSTLPYLRTANRHRFATLRDNLCEADRTLLILRVDRGLAWNEIACVLAGEALADDQVRRAAARLRKRFQPLKEELRGMARAAGMLADD
jgi:RNA polymerase sigma-70 factor, ECF subfamily